MNVCAICASAAVLVALVVTANGFAATAKEDPETPMSPELISRADATQLAQVALRECAARNLPASVMVTDSAGHLRVAMSDDNAKLIGVGSAQLKVNSVVEFKISTRALQERVQSDTAFADRYGNDERYHFSPGAFPIYRNDKFVAIIAVGGGRNIDEECALAALKTLSWAATEPPAQAPADKKQDLKQAKLN